MSSRISYKIIEMFDENEIETESEMKGENNNITPISTKKKSPTTFMHNNFFCLQDSSDFFCILDTK